VLGTEFQTEVLKSQSMEYDINQSIKETENRINFSLGRFPQKSQRQNCCFKYRS
jgi:hypothetical protein